MTRNQTVLALWFATMACGFYMFVRNEWVYRQRTRMIDRDIDQYMRLPSYDRMLYGRWWIWRIEDFL